MIYFDNASTTAMRPEAVSAMADAQANLYANASSPHSFALKAEKAVRQARQIIAQRAGVEPEELYFSPNGTLADCTAVYGALASCRGGRIITTAFEHPAVLQCFKKLENKFDVIYIRPGKDGLIHAQDVREALTPDTRLVSIMQVNNETGAISPLAQIADEIKRSGCGALMHTDAIQGFLKEPFAYKTVDMASFSAHKTHGPKGLGALYVRRGLKLRPVYDGGGQEDGLFSGTTNVPAIVAWAESCRLADPEAERESVSQISRRLRRGITDLGGRVISPPEASPYIINAVFEKYLADNIVNYMSERGIYISRGSACSSKKPSHVFKALGMEQYGKHALRISLSSANTERQAEVFLDTLEQALAELAH